MLCFTLTTVFKLGFEEGEILNEGVSYFDFEEYGSDGWIDFGQRYPKELFVKSKRFDKQSGARVIIKTQKNEIIKCLNNAPIELECMKDIAQVYKGYLYEGLHVEMTVGIGEQ